MRYARILGEGRSFYHCMSRVVDGRFIFGDREKEFFRKTMRKLEAFLGVRVVTYALMSNHFHLLLEVPDRDEMEELTVDGLLDLLPKLYGPGQVREIADELKRAEASGSTEWIGKILNRYQARRGDLSIFLKELKQRFGQWYNRRNNRRGTLWEERFKSVLVEGSQHALIRMAAYIDLNAVRAKLVDDPADYRWCGYGEAVAGAGAGGKLARQGLQRILDESGRVRGEADIWGETSREYRLLLFDHGQEREGKEMGQGGKKCGFSPQQVEAEFERRGELSWAEVLRCRVRYFSDGMVFGTKEFVESVFIRNRDRFGPNRETGALRIRGGALWKSDGDFHVMRDLR